MAASSMLNSIDTIVREDLMFIERVLEPRVDGIFSKMYDTSEGVVQGGGRAGSGTGFQVLHTFAVGVSGAFHNLSGDGDDFLDSDNTGNVFMFEAAANLQAFPATSDATAVGYVQKQLELVEGLGVFSLPIHLIMAEQLDATIAKPVALNIRGTAKNVAQSEANNFYATDGTNIALATLVDVSESSITNSTKTLTVVFGNTAHVTGRIGRFYPGMTVDIWDSGFTGIRNANALIVSKVDYVGRTLTILDPQGSDVDATNTITDNDVIVLWNSVTGSTAYGPKGVDHWTVASGTDIFNINLTNHPQFKSVVTAVNNVLDSAVLDTNIGAFYDAYGDIAELDSVITTAGVLNNYIQNTDGLWRYERHGTGALKLKEGWSSFDYEYQGKPFEVLQSRYVQNGTLYALKLGDQNIKRYVPPRIPSSGKRAEFAPEIQWYAPIAGSNSIFLPGRNASARVVRYVEAPFFCFREVCPDQLMGVKLTGLTELFT